MCMVKFQYIFIESVQVKIRKMKKTKNGQHKQPLNINISFNINPKHVLQSQHNANLKVDNNIYNSTSHSPNKSRTSQRQNAFSQFHSHRQNGKRHSKGNNQSFQPADLGQKQLDKLKKNFFTKINNIDIHLPTPLHQKPLQQKERRSSQFSIMSEKLQQYAQTQNNVNSKGPHPGMHLDLHHFQEEKSKILYKNQMSKMLGLQTVRKEKPEKKHSISQTKQVSKWLGHDKWQSCITQRKSRVHKDASKKVKRKVEKQMSLKQKLQKFKIDMMKLVVFYEENDVLKTKMSSQYYNIRSRQISKDNVFNGTQVEEHQKAEQIRNFQTNINSKEKEAQKSLQKIQEPESESLSEFKQMYTKLKEDNIEEESQRQQTKDLIEYYQRLSSGDNIPKEKVEIIDCISDTTQKLIQVERSTPQSSIDKLQQFDNEKYRTQEDKKAETLAKFVEFLQNKYKGGEKFNSAIDSLLEEYLEKGSKDLTDNKSDSIKEQEINCEQNILYESNQFILEIDDKINKELVQIPSQTLNITEKYELQPRQLVDLQRWEKNYTEELLNMKGKMWKQYRNLRNEVQSRISSGSNYKPFSTGKNKKTNKIMKCLSDHIFKSRFQRQTASQAVWVESKKFNVKEEKEHEESEEEKQKQESNQQLSPLGQHIYQELSEDLQQSQEEQVHGEQVMAGRVFFNEIQESKEQQFQEEIDIILPVTPQVLKEKVNPKLIGLSPDDKEDIFQFIFLDLCIELYQDYIEKEGMKNKMVESSSALRILNALREFIDNQKKLKNERASRKIGISTNINTVRLILDRLKNFLSQKQSEISSELVEKLNVPLGPTNNEMMKSLRIPVLQDASRQDYNEEYEEGDLLILQPNWFLQFQNNVIHIQELQFPKYYQEEERDRQRVNFLRNCTHIHHKVIYDALNENLDYCRVFGIWGRPFAWKNKANFEHQFQYAHLQGALNKAAAEVLRSSTFACGLLVNKEESLIKDLAQNEAYVKRLQDERIYKYLEDFVGDMEEKWFFFDDEETEVLMELSHLIWGMILKQVLFEVSVLTTIGS